MAKNDPAPTEDKAQAARTRNLDLALSRSRRTTAARRSAGSAMRRTPRSRLSRPGTFSSIARWASAVFRAAASSRFTGRNLGQDDAHAHCGRAGAETRRPRGLHRRRARARPGLREEARREARRSARLPAEFGRGSAAHLRDARALERARRDRGGLRRSARDEGEIEGEIGDAVVGAQARLMSNALRKLTAFIAKAQTVVIFTNQIREKIGVMFGNPETTPAARRSNSTPRCAATSAASARSSRAMAR